MRAHVGGRPAAVLAAIAVLLSGTIASATSTPATHVAAATPVDTAPARTKTPLSRRGPDIRSNAVLVIDESDSSVLLSKNADVALPIASITKLMTALVVVEANLPLDEPIKFTKEDRDVLNGGPSRLTAGATLSRGELLHLALMSSENHAAHALGRTFDGGTTAILVAMNTKAKVLGMKRTHFNDTTGLSTGNIASPEDLAKLVVAASQNPTIRKYSTDPDETVRVGRYPVEYRNTNNLVRKPDWDIIVQKTGYTQAAGRCLVMKAVIEDRPVVIVLMNSFGKYTRVADATRVRRWIEAESQPATLARTGK